MGSSDGSITMSTVATSGVRQLPTIEHRARGLLRGAADPDANMARLLDRSQSFRRQRRHEISLPEARSNPLNNRHRQCNDAQLRARHQLARLPLGPENVFDGFRLSVCESGGTPIEIGPALQELRLAPG